jgi:hypothetical protein
MVGDRRRYKTQIPRGGISGETEMQGLVSALSSMAEVICARL